MKLSCGSMRVRRTTQQGPPAPRVSSQKSAELTWGAHPQTEVYMYQIQCAEVWGGVKNEDLEAQTPGLRTSLFSGACGGDKGGDIYFLSVCGQAKLTRVAVADVRGHGEAVSHVSEWLYSALHARMDTPDTGLILSDLNTLAIQKGMESMTTVAILGLYASHGLAYFTYAGHMPALLRRAGATDWEPVSLGDQSAHDGLVNLPLGVDPETSFTQREISVQPGDRLLLYTDGVTETPAPNGELFGLERLQDSLAQASRLTLHDTKAAVLKSLRDYNGGEPCHDDVTLLAVELL